MKFSIRDLMWLTVVAALVLGWWVNRAALLERSKTAERAAVRQGKIATAYKDAMDAQRLLNSQAPVPKSPNH